MAMIFLHIFLPSLSLPSPPKMGPVNIPSIPPLFGSQPRYIFVSYFWGEREARVQREGGGCRDGTRDGRREGREGGKEGNRWRGTEGERDRGEGGKG